MSRLVAQFNEMNWVRHSECDLLPGVTSPRDFEKINLIYLPNYATKLRLAKIELITIANVDETAVSVDNSDAPAIGRLGAQAGQARLERQGLKKICLVCLVNREHYKETEQK